jgi:hypothetical protein
MALSPYYVGPAVRLSTDDVALALVVGSLVALERGRFAAATVLAASAAGTPKIASRRGLTAPIGRIKLGKIF